MSGACFAEHRRHAAAVTGGAASVARRPLYARLMGRHGFFRVPPVDEDRRPIDRATVRRVIAAFRPYKGKVGLVGLAIVITSGLGVANPLLIKWIFDNGLFGDPPGSCGGSGCPDLHTVYIGVALMIAIPVVTGIIGIGQTYLANLVGLRVMQDFRNALYEHLQFMPLRFFTTTRTGEIQSRLANDVGGVQTVVTDTASSILSNVVVILSTLVAMLLLSIPLTILSLFMLPFFVWLTVKVGRARREVATSTQKTLADLTAVTEETLSVSGILLSKSFGRQRFEIGRFRSENERLTGFQIRQTMIGRSFFAIVGTFFSITPALVYLVAGWVIADRGLAQAGITAGTIVAFTTLQSRLFFPIGSMLQVSTEVQSSLALFDRIFEYLDLPHEIRDAPDAVALEAVTGHVRLRDVRFRYEDPPAEEMTGIPVSPDTPPLADDAPVPREWTLEDVDLDIRPGQLAALVGPSGAGKTTVTYLVPRLYDVQEGTVEIDGLDVQKIKLESLGEAIGVVTQETYLFHDTVRRNLLYGKPDASDEELIAAARAANIHDRIAELPDGYDTVVGERGYKLSGGEKQRLAIARVVLKDPRILILDEATSSLDTTSERLVQSALEPLMKGRTTIAIAHRLSTILSADVIFVMDRGRIVEQGTHEELVGHGGLYAQVYEQQFRGGLVEAEFEDGVILASGEVVRTAS
jgi:ATP-binding cassette, subfamily B, bacterial